jgi:beta-lactamase regulating signal transducer with metallopeptidase domain
MSEAIFPLLGSVLVFVVVLPLAALLAKLLLAAVDRSATRTELHTHHCLRYVLLVGSSAAPLAWFVSASLHQAETGRSTSACTLPHASETFCPEAAFFALALATCAALFALPRFLRDRPVVRAAQTQRERRAACRLRSLMRQRPRLMALTNRLDVRDGLTTPIRTTGIIRPRVVVATSFVEKLDDEALAAALHHEFEHVRDGDPLRYLVAWWALAVNPIGRVLLDKELSRWVLAREVHCDREAVLSGASAAALAHAIVTAARPMAGSPSPALGEADAPVLALRINLLLAYSERRPKRCCRQPALRFALCAILLVALLPHGGSTGALDAVHVITESAIALIARS